MTIAETADPIDDHDVTGPRGVGAAAHRGDPRSGPALLVTKLRPPPGRDQLVVRERLLERLRRVPAARLTVVAAPPGYGKTTLLAKWREQEATRRPVAWLTLDEGDNDPVTLWSYVLAALGEACPEIGDLPSPQRVGSARVADVVLPRLVNSLAEQDDVTLILDDFHRLGNGDARDGVAWLVDHAPATFQLVVASRTEPALRLASLRAHRELLEVHGRDLRFTDDEADVLMNELLDLQLAEEDVAELVARTEGWPAGLYLAALSLAGAEDRPAFVGSFGGSSRHVVDFLADEVLEASPPAVQDLMLRCSVADRLCGPLCDAILERAGGAEQLDAIGRTNLFLVPLDDHGQWYRFHRVFQQLLRVELEHRRPGLAPELHRRASAWHCEHGSVDEAIDHAVRGGAFEEASALIQTIWIDCAKASRHDTVLGWLERIPVSVRFRDARLLAVEAWIQSLCARREEAARAIAAIEQLGGLDDGPLRDGFSSIEASLRTLGAVFPRGDVGSMGEQAARAGELEGPESPYRPHIAWAAGISAYYRDDRDEADRRLDEAARLAPVGEQWRIAGSSLAYRALIAGDRGELDVQAMLAEEAMTLARERDIETSDGEVFLAMAASLAARGNEDEALVMSERGVDALRAWGQPLGLAEALIRHVPVLRALGEHERAAAAMVEARSIVEACPDPGNLEKRMASLEAPPRPRAGQAQPGADLSAREIAVLRMLSGSLSERDIGRELYLSYNTIHSHTRSIYRKLGVRSRREAVHAARARRLISTGSPR